MAHLVKSIIIGGLAGLAILTGGAYAQTGQTLPDPTRPPSYTAAGGAGSGASGTEPAPVTGPVLQSVIIRPGSKPTALITGEWVTLGGLYAGAKLIKVTDSTAVLRGPNGVETLTITPAATKVSTPPVVKPMPGTKRESGSKP